MIKRLLLMYCLLLVGAGLVIQGSFNVFPNVPINPIGTIIIGCGLLFGVTLFGWSLLVC